MSFKISLFKSTSNAEVTFTNEVLEAINNVRSKHQAPPLKLNDKISKVTSQSYSFLFYS